MQSKDRIRVQHILDEANPRMEPKYYWHYDRGHRSFVRDGVIMLTVSLRNDI